jgi:hypothetical protein
MQGEEELALLRRRHLAVREGEANAVIRIGRDEYRFSGVGFVLRDARTGI